MSAAPPAAAVAAACGLALVHWRWLAGELHVDVHGLETLYGVPLDYWLGFGVAFALGCAFPRRPVVCALAFVLAVAWSRLGEAVAQVAQLLVSGGIPHLGPGDLSISLVVALPFAGTYLGSMLRGQAQRSRAA